MTDFRRPDLDLWEEEDDAEDARPTIVSERPGTALGPQTLVHGIKQPVLGQLRVRSAGAGASALPALDPTLARGVAPPEQDRLTPEVGRNALMQRLIEQGALEEDLLARDSAENLRDSEIAALRISGPGSARPPSLPHQRASGQPAEPDARAEPAARHEPSEHDDVETISEAETEDVTEELVPTVAVRRPQPPLSTGSGPHVLPPPAISARAPESALRPAASGRDRDVTERISLESPLSSSLAPTSHTLRPGERTQKTFPWWQTALAALALVGGGLGVSQLRRLNRQSAEVSAAASESRRPEPAREAIPEPSPTPSTPAPVETVAPAAGPVSAVAQPEPGPPLAAAAALPKPALPRSAPRKVSAPKPAPSAEPAEPAVSAEKPSVVPEPTAQELPSQPDRDQVTAALNAVIPELQKCVGDRHGTAELTLTVRPAGVVSYAVVGGMYAGTPEGSCLARAVKTAKFPAFSDPALRVSYPFQL